MKRFWVVGVLVASMTTLTSQAVAEGDAAKGEKLFKGFFVVTTAIRWNPA